MIPSTVRCKHQTVIGYYRLIMDALNNIINHCHKRHAEEDVLRQRKTVVTPALYKIHPFQIKVHCARGNAIPLDLLEKAEISFMPIGHALENNETLTHDDSIRYLQRKKQELGR